MLWITRARLANNRHSCFVQKVHRLGKRKGNWLLLPLGAAISLSAVLLWPKPPSNLVLVANHDIAAGQRLEASDFSTRAVPLGDSASLYLGSLPANSFSFTAIANGQLLSRNQVSPSPTEALIPTVFNVKDSLPTRIRAGSQVDVWSAIQSQEPSPIALDCQVLSLASSSSLGQKSVEVEVGCLAEFLPQLLAAKAAKAEIAIVPEPTYLDQ